MSRSTDLSQASTVIAGADSSKKFIPPGIRRKDMKEEAARKERGEDCRGGGWRGGGVDRWGDRSSKEDPDCVSPGAEPTNRDPECCLDLYCGNYPHPVPRATTKCPTSLCVRQTPVSRTMQRGQT